MRIRELLEGQPHAGAARAALGVDDAGARRDPRAVRQIQRDHDFLADLEQEVGPHEQPARAQIRAADPELCLRALQGILDRDRKLDQLARVTALLALGWTGGLAHSRRIIRKSRREIQNFLIPLRPNMVLKPIEKQRVAEEIAGQLRSLILTGHYAVGERLPPERDLAKTLGVNRASLREALKKLEHLGLVKIRQGDGTRVLDFMQTGGMDSVSHLIPLAQNGNVDLLTDVIEFRQIYGREVARLAALRATPEALTRLREAAEAAARDVSLPELLKLDFEFYVALTAAAKNRVFMLLINTTRAAVLDHAEFFSRFIPPAEVRKHHRDIIKAIEAKDADKAAKAADAYLGRGREALLALSAAK